MVEVIVAVVVLKDTVIAMIVRHILVVLKAVAQMAPVLLVVELMEYSEEVNFV